MHILEAVELFNSEGFFRHLPAMEGGIEAVQATLYILYAKLHGLYANLFIL